jgi:hypothetical protein
MAEKESFELATVRLGKRDNAFPQYQLETAPIMLEGTNGEIVESGRKFVIKNGLYVGDVSKRYRLFPNELALEIGDKIAKELGFRQLKTINSRGGNAIYSVYVADNAISDIPHTFVEAKPGDGIQLGWSLRNSIDGSTAFGSDLFSFRSVCSNGAIIGRRVLGVAPLRRHTGKMEDFAKDLVGRLRAFLSENLESLAMFYRALPQIEINLEVAKALSNALPARYLPEYIVVERKTKKVSLEANADAYDAYNRITEALWHSDRVDPKSATTYMTNVHAVLEPLVARVVA